MDEAKICISLVARDFDSLERLLESARSATDIVEIRLDALEEIPSPSQFLSLKSENTIVLTLRPQEQGGFKTIAIEERIGFWNRIADSLPDLPRNLVFDIEGDIRNRISLPKERVIASLHDFGGCIPDIDEVISDLSNESAVVKVAWKSANVDEALDAFRLLGASRDGMPGLVPIAMGEAGKISRILGPAFGAAYTYSFFESDSPMAPGQLSLAELRDTYRIDSLTRQHSVYGLLAGDTSYSYSPRLHNLSFAMTGHRGVFVPMQTDDAVSTLERVMRLIGDSRYPDFKGFAVTNPHKRRVMEICDHIDESARTSGSVNTLRIEDGELKGFNTDVIGFVRSLKSRAVTIRDTNIAVIGTGGAARSAISGLIGDGAKVTVFGRNEFALGSLQEEFSVSTSALSDDDFSDFDIVVNATPLGTKGRHEAETVATEGQLKGVRLAFDMVYNPRVTRFLKEAAAAGCATIDGLDMLVRQGLAQQSIWTGVEPDASEILENLTDNRESS